MKKWEDKALEYLLKADNVLHGLAARRALKTKSSSWEKINLDLDEWARMLAKICGWLGTKDSKQISGYCKEWLSWKPPEDHPKLRRAKNVGH